MNMNELKFCPEFKSAVIVSSCTATTDPIGAAGKKLHMTSFRCSCEDKCHHTYDCIYSFEGKTFDPCLRNLIE